MKLRASESLPEPSLRVIVLLVRLGVVNVTLGNVLTSLLGHERKIRAVSFLMLQTILATSWPLPRFSNTAR
jgi:hypothetical protein